MKIVFIMPLWRRTQFVRIFESTLRLLCERGHHVHVGFVSRKKAGHGTAAPTDLVQQLVADYPNCSCGTAPIREDAWGLLGATLRASSDYLRYLTPPYRNARMLRERAAANVLPRVITLTRQGPFGTGPGRALVKAWCRFLDRCIPVSAEIDRFLMEQRPDLLLCSPLIEPGTPQMEYVRAARARGIRVVLCVASWDNLTNKGLIHGPLDLVTVWNDAMKREAVELHGVPAERVAVTGAQLFDHWFDWRPSTPRDTFCARVGLTASQPYILYSVLRERLRLTSRPSFANGPGNSVNRHRLCSAMPGCSCARIRTARTAGFGSMTGSSRILRYTRRQARRRSTPRAGPTTSIRFITARRWSP